MRTAVIQHDIVWEDPPANHAHVAPMIARAAGAGAELVVLPEMFATGFSMVPERAAEEPGGPTERFLRDQAVEHGIWLIGTIAQLGPRDVEDAAAARRGVNVAVVAGPAGEQERYVKIHPFSFAGEDELYDAGRHFLTVDVAGLRVTVFICYDLRFADEFWVCAEGTDLFVVPANWPESRREHWRTLLRARAIENQAYVVGCNRVGDAQGVAHTGDSVVVDPLGRALVEASSVETVLFADVEPSEIRRVREHFPFLQDRR